jgi:hypothetical protein
VIARDHHMGQTRILVMALLASQLTLAAPSVTFATWPPTGVPLEIATNEDPQQSLATDGNSGVIVAWASFDDDYDISRVFVQRISAAGGTFWSAGGIPVTSILGHQFDPVVTHDGAGGAFIAWTDNRGNGTCCSNSRVYIQRFNPYGAPLWADDGVPVHDLVGQGSPTLVADDEGGCIVMWSGYGALYAQRFDHTGAKQWLPGGVSICSDCWMERELVAISDGDDGAIVAWVDNGLSFNRLFSQRILSSGNVAWMPGGVPLTESESMKFLPEITTDGNGGAYVTWSDYDGNDMRALIQRVSQAGTTTWPPNGYRISDADTWQSSPSPAEDGTGGVIVSWQEYDGGLPSRVFAQRLNQIGEKQWGPGGVSVCGAAGGQGRSSAHYDGNGGAVVMWLDQRTATVEVAGQRLDPTGELLWTSDGILFGTGWLADHGPTAISDGAGGSLLVRQVATPTWRELFVHRVTSTGESPTSVPRPQTSNLILGSATPNPFSSTTFFEFEVSGQSSVSVEVYDVTGTRVWAGPEKPLSGPGRFYFEGRDYTGRLLPSGVYFCRVSANGETITRKMVIAR